MLNTTQTDRSHWFFGPVMSCKAVYLQVMWASVLINVFALASSVYIMTVYDRVVPNNAIESLWALTAMIACVIIFDLIMKILRGIFVDRAGARVDQKVSAALFERIARHDASLTKTATGSLAGTVRNFDMLKDAIGSASFTVLVDLPFIFLFIYVLFLIGGPLAYVPLVIVPTVIVFALILQPIIKRMTELSQSQGKSKQAVIVEMIAALETVKTVRGISMLRNRWMNSVASPGQIEHEDQGHEPAGGAVRAVRPAGQPGRDGCLRGVPDRRWQPDHGPAYRLRDPVRPDDGAAGAADRASRTDEFRPVGISGP